MKAIYNNKIVDVWEIGQANQQPDWVREAFEKGYLRWVDNRLLILMAGLNPNSRANLKLGLMGSLGGGGFLGYHMYRKGDIGDYLDGTNHRLLSRKQFEKSYQVYDKDDTHQPNDKDRH